MPSETRSSQLRLPSERCDPFYTFCSNMGILSYIINLGFAQADDVNLLFTYYISKFENFVSNGIFILSL